SWSRSAPAGSSGRPRSTPARRPAGPMRSTAGTPPGPEHAVRPRARVRATGGHVSFARQCHNGPLPPTTLSGPHLDKQLHEAEGHTPVTDAIDIPTDLKPADGRFGAGPSKI